MVSKANRRADEAELRLQQERERNDAERRLERERSDAERQRQQERYDLLLDELRAERRHTAAAQQQLIASMAEISANFARLVDQQNGRRNGND